MKMPSTRQIRRILATVIVIIALALTGAVLIRQLRSPSPVSVERPTSPEIDMAINRLQFSEMRGNEKLWDLAAERAEYDKDSGIAQLETVKADIYEGKAGGMEITSKSGTFDEKAKLVQMRTKVRVVTKKGMVLDTEQLEYRTGPGLITTTSPVVVRDGRLTLHARGMTMSLHEETVRFNGPVDAVIEGYHAKK